MSNNSLEDIEKDATFRDPHDTTDREDEKVSREPYLTEQEQDVHDAADPPFTEHPGLGNSTEDGSPLEQVPSAKHSANNIKSVPNGGLTAWLQVLGGFFIYWNTWGVVNTYGSYQTYYETGILSSHSPSDIAWIGSLQATLLLVVGSVTGPIYDAGYVHSLVIVGSLLLVVGQMMLSLCTEYWQVILTQGICQGIGCGCLFVPAVATISTYFSTKIATATGLAAAGSSLGGVVYPIVFHRLEPRIGFPWAVRVQGFLMLATLMVTNSVLRVRVLPAGRRKFLDLGAFREPPYVLYVGGCLLTFVGLYQPFFFVQSYAIETGITDENLAFYLLSIINGASTFGRIIPGYISDTVGPMNMIVPCSMMAGVLILLLIATHTTAGIIVVLAFYGFFSGTQVSLPPTIFVHLTKNRSVIGTRMGMGFAIIAIGLLVGTPIGGAILNSTGSFAYMWLFGGILTCFGTLLIAAARVAQGGASLKKKV